VGATGTEEKDGPEKSHEHNQRGSIRDIELKRTQNYHLHSENMENTVCNRGD
jgi:hypothetical protein